MPARISRRLEAARQAVHLGRGAGPAEYAAMAHIGAALFAGGATLGLVSLLLPAGGERDTPRLLGIIAVAYVAAAALLLVYRRAAGWVFDGFAALATALVSGALYVGGPPSGFNRLFYVWIVLYAAYFFSWRRTAFQVALVGVGYALVVRESDPSGPAPLVWLLTFSTLAVAGALVTALRGRSERLVEHEREHVGRLLELDRLKDELVATVSHELRTPLTSVYGAAQTLERRDLDDEMRRSLLAVITQESRRLANLVEDVLLAGRIDTGQLGVAVEPCDGEAIAREVVEVAALTAPGRITLELAAADGLPSVSADAGRLRQVLSNLLDNAVKYSPDGGAVVVELSRRDGSVRFAVRDEGLGIPERDLDAIFEKFHRLDPNMRRGVGGSGLGLYVSRALVERMGGRIWAESRPGGGSTFFVELPAA